MAHCHIAEHTEMGMMFMFDVEPQTAVEPSPPLAGGIAVLTASWLSS